MLVHRVAEFAGAALSTTYFVALLIKAQPAEHAGYDGLGVLLVVLLLAVLAAAGAATLHLRWMALAAVRRRATTVAAVEMRSRGAGAQPRSTVINPAWEEEAEEGATARVTKLETELQAVKREHAKYTSARIAAELEKREEAHATALEEAQLEHEKREEAHATELEAARAHATAAEAEAAQAKAELAQLKAKTE